MALAFECGKMKRFCLACVGFSLLCVAFSCGQQAFKQPANAAGVQPGSQWVHATTNYIPEQKTKVLLNLNYVEFITSDGVAITPAMAGDAKFQIDAADIPK
jgi:hypothetical protein